MTYVLGHSDAELQRLIVQARLLGPITRRYLHEAGSAPVMRVLDVGCGTGEVTFLLAELLGGVGTVVGVDSATPALIEARERAKARFF
jgi:ubiquinone/menaquinone biosynthesis C-methylase UbiE